MGPSKRRERVAGTTAEKKARGRAKLNERALELERENRALRKRIEQLLEESWRPRAKSTLSFAGKGKKR